MTGSCLCGAVKYVIKGRVGRAFYCHCSRCRKASGSAFATNVAIEAAGFRLMSGEDALRSLIGLSGLERMFCGMCGSPILSRRLDQPEVLRLRVGTLDSDLPNAPEAHAFTGSMAPWYVITDDLPRCDERLPPEFGREFPYES